jgi:pimeloyl-ACP methyl ester carboxylesterase
MSDKDEIINAIAEKLGRPTRVRRPPGPADLEFVEGRLGKVAYTTEGAGASVLIVHGWEGGPRDFSSMVPAIVQSPARAVSIDLPGHGASDGERITPDDAGEAILAVAKREGPFVAIIAHSFGCGATMRALELGLKTGALVFFSPGVRPSAGLRRMGERYGLTAEDMEKVRARVREQGFSVPDFDLTVMAKARSEPLLIIHSRDDEMTPFEGAEELAAAWPGAKLLEADGLGHNGAMRDRAMIAATLRFALGA